MSRKARIANILFWSLVTSEAIVFALANISQAALPVVAISIFDCLVITHFFAIFVFPILLRFKGVRLLPRVLFMMIGFPAFGLSLISISTWFLKNQGLCAVEGYDGLPGFWLFVPYFPLAACVVIFDAIFTYLKYLWRKKKLKAP